MTGILQKSEKTGKCEYYTVTHDLEVFNKKVLKHVFLTQVFNITKFHTFLEELVTLVSGKMHEVNVDGTCTLGLKTV